MKNRVLYYLKKDIIFKLVIFIILILHSVILLKYDVISFQNDEYCGFEYKTNDKQICDLKSNTIFESEKNVLVLYDDSYGLLNTFHSIIQEKIKCDIYNIRNVDDCLLHDYDLILLGNTLINNQMSQSMINFLNHHDFSRLDISPYWIGGVDHELFETSIQSYIKDAQILSGLGFNTDEISEIEEINDLIEEWLLTIYTYI